MLGLFRVRITAFWAKKSNILKIEKTFLCRESIRRWLKRRERQRRLKMNRNEEISVSQKSKEILII